MNSFCKIIFVAFLFVLFSGCKTKAENHIDQENIIVAIAGSEKLDFASYKSSFVSTGIVSDSAYNAKKSIENWARESLFYQEATSKLSDEELMIENQVLEYRKTLVNYIYQCRMVDANLDTVISFEEIESYYNEHRDNFILKDNIVKVNYLKVPLMAQGLPKIKKLVWSNDLKDRDQLLVLCTQNAENFFMNDSIWLFLDEIKKEIPALKDQPDYSISKGRVLEFNDDKYYYYLKVKDIKVKNGFSPINFETQNIKKFILNNRKTQLITQYKLELLEKAKAEKSFVIY